MDAILVFDPNNYLIHSIYNHQFLDEIARIALENKQIPATTTSAARRHLQRNEAELRNLVVLLLGPFVASIKVLQSECPRIDLFGSKSSSIRIFYYEYLDFMFVYLCDVNAGWNDLFMQRKLEFFVELSKFLFGANLQQMDVDSKQNRLLILLFQNWQDQRHKPMFLLESLERLIVNCSLRNTFENMLAEHMDKLSAHLDPLSEEIPCESWLFINDKLICTHKATDAPSIVKSDELLLALLVNTFFKCLSNTPSQIRISSSSDDEGQHSADSDDVERSIDVGSNVQIEMDINCTKQAQLSTPSSDSGQFAHKSEDIIRLLSARDQYLFDDCEQRLLFLHSYLDPSNLVPFYVRFVRLSDELALITLSELPSTFLTYHGHSLLTILNAVQYHPQELHCFRTIKQLEHSTNKLLQYSNRLAERNWTGDAKRQALCRTLIARLNVLTASALKKYILSLEPKPLCSQLESLCTTTSRCLREVLDQLVYRYHQQQLSQIEQQVTDRLTTLKKQLCSDFKDYSEFLSVKCARNVAIEPYNAVIPNLVCFVFVDRSMNEFVATSTGSEPDHDRNANHHNLPTSIESPYYEWLPTDLYEHVMTHVIQRSYASLSSTGQLFCRWVEGTHLYNYCIWFEDQTGNVIEFKRKAIAFDSFPNLTTSNFVEKMAKYYFPAYRLRQNDRYENCQDRSIIVKGLRKFWQPEIRCYELFYVQQSIDSDSGRRLRYLNSLKNDNSNGPRLDSLIDSSTAISKRFADKLNDFIRFTKQTNFNQQRPK